ncbi:aminotransferase [Lampropedia cohaerens]|uniref:Aminotransferase n=1 Tax=Lampropedia cohaerens TaxID=1610491 RepID=A0A0U1PX27_9BURK|nr:fatty acid desaturase [Lampropedia cohaerens]KKW67031.1 aminotransferase [Lampropedia cohaerens]
MVSWQSVLDWAAGGITGWSWCQIVIFTLVVTHITSVSVTLYLHRAQAHRALEVHPALAHFFRFWLWLTTGMSTREWVAIHRKHHAKCETEQDPHSPQVFGIKKVMWEGAELYRAEARNAETLRKFSHGTPDDWLERNVYARWSMAGVSAMLIVDVALFGLPGLAVWAVQMAWIPFWAAGVVNGLGHYWGYRNFEAQDASRNLTPWGVVIGGEELHNNHHTYPTSAKFSVKPYEFDLGWLYIRLLQAVGLAKVKKVPPRLVTGAPKPEADVDTLESLIANRYAMMAAYARSVKRTSRAELARIRALGAQVDARLYRAARRWLHRDVEQVPPAEQAQLAQLRQLSPVLDQMVQMREELRQLWLSTSLSRDQLLERLQQWCRKAEASGIGALQEFARQLRRIRAA